MGILTRIRSALLGTASETAVRSFDAATGGRRGNSFRSFGPVGAETLAAAAPLRSRARHAFANNAWIGSGVAAIVAETVGAGIEANSSHPDSDQRAEIDAIFLAAAKGIDAEQRTDLRGLTAAVVQAVVVDGEAFVMIEEGPDGIRLRQISMTRSQRKRAGIRPTGSETSCLRFLGSVSRRG